MKEATTIKTYKLPPTFWLDHTSRDLPEEGISRLVKQTKAAVWVEMDEAALADLRSDAAHYSDAGIAAEMGLFGLYTSARATLRAIDKQEQAEARALADQERLATEPAAHTPTDGAEPQEGDAKAMASKKQTTQTPEATEPQADLHKELVAQLKEAGLKVTPKWSPTKKYAAYKAPNGKTLAYVFAQTSSGIKVKAGLEMKELDRASKKAWVDNSKEAPFSIRGFFTQANLDVAVEAIKATAEKQEQAQAAKAEAKKAPAKKALTKKASSKKSQEEVVAEVAEAITAGELEVTA